MTGCWDIRALAATVSRMPIWLLVTKHRHHVFGAAPVWIPPTSVFDIIRTISQSLALYEQKFGPIRTPGAALPPEERAQRHRNDLRPPPPPPTTVGV